MQRKNTKMKFIKSIRILSRFFFPHPRASLVVVTNQWELCQQEAERNLCRVLRDRGYYPSPDYFVDSISINVAIVPYRVALIRKQEATKERKIARLLQRKGWSVYFYSEEHIRKDIDRLLYSIESNIEPLENASLHI
ncbi:hypothetical protein [Shouchella patagoniensis]|uniref:hypothetical protein n=1 Tax=Shouchella patagoniensis TaxID=228576 RepID=UPI00099500DD|nr:hypothetical protein [Shouchella patagoniensis]